jgi:hypothetical protein
VLRLGDQVSNPSFRDRPPTRWPNGGCIDGPIYRLQVPVELERLEPPGAVLVGQARLEGNGLRPEDVVVVYGEDDLPWTSAPEPLKTEFQPFLQDMVLADYGVSFGFGRLDWNHPEYGFGAYGPPRFILAVWDTDDQIRILSWGYWEWIDAPQ